MKKLLISGLLIFAMMMIVGCTSSSEDDFSGTINIYTRDTSSGTRDGFMKGIGFGDAATDDSLLASGFTTTNNAGIMDAMRTDMRGIGYVSLASVNDTIKALNFEGVAPSLETVLDDSYELKRPFNFMLRADDDFENDTMKELAYAFIAYLQSQEGADVINDTGAIAVGGDYRWEDVVDEHPVCALDNSGETLRFGGSDSITAVAVALSEDFAPRCGNVVTENNHTGSSDGYKRTQGEEKDGVNAVEIGYASRPFRGEEVDNTDETTRGQLAWDAIVAIVHVDNPIDGLTAEQLTKIYSGEITDWEELLD